MNTPPKIISSTETRTEIILILAIFVVLSTSVGTSYAQQILWVDKQSYLIGDQVEISGLFGTATGFEKTITLSNPTVSDLRGNPLEIMSSYEKIQIGAKLQNLKETEQPYAFLVKIQDSKQETIFLEWVKGTLAAQKSGNVALYWTPEFFDNYELSMFVWEDFDKPRALSPKVTISLSIDSAGRVSHSFPEYSSSQSNLYIDEQTLRVFHAGGNLVEINQLPSSGSFYSSFFLLDEHLPKPMGKYFVNVRNSDSFSIASFTLEEPPISTPPPKPDPNPPIPPPEQSIPSPKNPIECRPGTELIDGVCIPPPISPPGWNPITIATTIAVAAAGGMILLLKTGLIAGSKMTSSSVSSVTQGSSSVEQSSQTNSGQNSSIEKEYDPFSNLTEIELEIRGGFE